MILVRGSCLAVVAPDRIECRASASATDLNGNLFMSSDLQLGRPQCKI